MQEYKCDVPLTSTRLFNKLYIGRRRRRTWASRRVEEAIAILDSCASTVEDYLSSNTVGVPHLIAHKTHWRLIRLSRPDVNMYMLVWFLPFGKVQHYVDYKWT